LGGRKGTQPVKKLNDGCWHGYLSGEGTDLHMAQLMPLPLTVSCFSKIQIGFTFLVPAQLGIVEKEKNVCVCVPFESSSDLVSVGHLQTKFLFENFTQQRK